MANINKIIREEIARAARGEVRKAVAPLRKSAAESQKVMTALKRQVSALERECRRHAAVPASAPRPVPEAPPDESGTRFTAKSIRSLRRKLGLSQAEFARLAGVSTNTVSLWERKEGRLLLRQKAQAALLSIRDLSAGEAKRRLEEMGVVVKAPAGKARRKRKAAPPAANA